MLLSDFFTIKSKVCGNWDINGSMRRNNNRRVVKRLLTRQVVKATHNMISKAPACVIMCFIHLVILSNGSVRF